MKMLILPGTVEPDLLTGLERNVSSVDFWKVTSVVAPSGQLYRSPCGTSPVVLPDVEPVVPLVVLPVVEPVVPAVVAPEVPPVVPPSVPRPYPEPSGEGVAASSFFVQAATNNNVKATHKAFTVQLLR